MDKNRKNQQKITDDELARLEELNNKRKSLGKERDAAERKKYWPFKKAGRQVKARCVDSKSWYGTSQWTESIHISRPNERTNTKESLVESR